MMIKRSKSYLLVISLILFVGLTGCGKEKDPQTTEVMKLSLTPEATPTPTPKVINSAAVTTSGELTMVNEFRVSEDTAAADAAGADGFSADSTAEMTDGQAPETENNQTEGEEGSGSGTENSDE